MGADSNSNNNNNNNNNGQQENQSSSPSVFTQFSNSVQYLYNNPEFTKKYFTSIDLKKQICFREPVLWSLVSGSLMFIHRYQNPNFEKSIQWKNFVELNKGNFKKNWYVI